MKPLRSACKCIVVFLLLCTFIQIIESGRGGFGRIGGSRSSSSGSRGWSWGGSRSSSSSSSSSSSNRGSSSHTFTPVYIPPSRTNIHSTSHVLPVSTGARTNTAQQSHITPQRATSLHSATSSGGSHAPSAPQLPSSHNQPAPPIGWNTNNNKPGQAPAPGWNVGNNGNTQSGAGMHPPPYSSVANHPSGNPPPYSSIGHHPNGPPPPYSASNQYPNAHPPPYHPGGVNNYPGAPSHGVPPPPYPGTSYLSAGHYGAMNGGHYPTQHGQPNYYQTPHHYPQPNNLPPPPPGYSPYGVPYYQKPSSGIRASDVMMGLALWQLTKPAHTHNYYGSGYDNYNNNPGYGYHEFNRQRYTTTYGSQNSYSNAPGAHNTLEMTHYVVPDNSGTYKTVVGNMTCLSVYDAKAVNKWANRTMDDFHKKFPGSEFPLFESGKNGTNKFENFTMIPGRVIHEETVSVTCCGTDKGPLELSMLTSGKSPDVNCLHFIGKIPFRKLTFVKVQHVPTVNTNMTDWNRIQLVSPDLNATSTPTPLAPYPNSTESSISTTPSVNLTQTFSPLGLNNTSNTTLENDNTENVTFPSLGSINTTETNTFPSLGINGTI